MMKRTHHRNIWTTALLAGVLLALGWVDVARAQFDTKWLNAGSLANDYSEAGAQATPGGRSGYALDHWYENGDTDRGGAMWVGARNVKDETGKVWPIRIAHLGQRFSGEGEWFPVKFDMISRFEPPEVEVDGLQSFRYLVDNDFVDPELPADRMIHIVTNSLIGVTVEQKAFQFSNPYHDNYHIVEYVLTNTGNIDGDEEVENPNETLEDVYFMTGHKYTPATALGAGVSRRHGFNPSAWGRDQMNDAVGDGHEDYDVDFTAQYAWKGSVPEFRGWNDIGMPSIDGVGFYSQDNDSTGRLTADVFMGRVYMHADQTPRTLNEQTNPVLPVPRPFEQNPNDPAQPSSMFYYGGDDEAFGCDPCAWDPDHLQMAWDRFMVPGRVYPHHADLIAPGGPWSAERFANQTKAPSDLPDERDTAGWNFGETFGPYTLEPGESVRIVVADVVAGLSRAASMAIGAAYKEAWRAGEENRPIPYDANGDGQIDPVKEQMRKNLWVMTARDSLFQAFERARANMESGYQIPRAPAPPGKFMVNSGPDRIVLTWETLAGEPDPVSWEIYRAQGNFLWKPYEHIGTVSGSERRFDDTGAARGVGYYYYLQAVGPPNNDGTGLTPTGVAMRSSRAYTQTYDPAMLTRPPGPDLASIRVVPNPYILDADENIRWPDQQDKIAFLNIPGQCTIEIYTEIGERIYTIEHTNGSGDAYWDLTTSSRQVVVSGLYLAVIRDQESGNQVLKKFVVIR